MSVTAPPAVDGTDQRRGYRPGGIEIAVGVAVLLLLLRPLLAGVLSGPALEAATTIFLAIVLQALPFLVLGVLLSAAITAFVPPTFWQRALPSRPALAVPVAGCAGAVVPGCECASVPVSGALMSRGVAPAAALAFLLSSPAINPVVIVSTFVAFPNNHVMALARFVASLLTAVAMGWLWLRFGRGGWLRIPRRRHADGTPRTQVFLASAGHDFLHAGGFLVIGGMAAAVLNVFVPREWLSALADKPVLSVVALAALAVVLSICSEADAFVAASLSEFSLTALLAFLVVGPMVDMKLIALQAGTFGRRFAVRFAPATFAMAILVSLLVGAVVW
ncbi:MAG: permease [Candidatus Nanopelagicales bacterium]